MGTNNGILTIKDLMSALVGLPEDTQIVIQDRKNYILNIQGVEFPDFEESFAVYLIGADTFDPRQF